MHRRPTSAADPSPPWLGCRGRQVQTREGRCGPETPTSREESALPLHRLWISLPPLKVPIVQLVAAVASPQIRHPCRRWESRTTRERDALLEPLPPGTNVGAALDDFDAAR
ncbi:hypothetical protein AHAS_Ahas17G0100000 [Arachis hypogaea]